MTEPKYSIESAKEDIAELRSDGVFMIAADGYAAALRVVEAAKREVLCECETRTAVHDDNCPVELFPDTAAELEGWE